MSAKFDEFPSLHFQDIKEKPKHHGRTDGRTHILTDGHLSGMRRSTGLSAPLLFAYGRSRFSHDVAHMKRMNANKTDTAACNGKKRIGKTVLL